MYEKITNVVGMGLVYLASIGLPGGDKEDHKLVKEGQFSCSIVRDDLDHKCRLCNPGGDKKPESPEFPNIHPGVIDPAPSYDIDGKLDRVEIGLKKPYSRMFPKNPFDVGTGPYNPHPKEIDAIIELRMTGMGNISKLVARLESFDLRQYKKNMEDYRLQVIAQNSPADEYREKRGKEPPGAGPTPEQDRDRTREQDRERDRKEHEKREKEKKENNPK